MRTATARRAAAIRPFGTGVLIRAPQTALVDIAVTGVPGAAIVVNGTSFAGIVASDVRDNPDAALTIRSASARLVHNVPMRNWTSERVRRSFIIDDGANLRFTGNVFHDVSRDHDHVDDSPGGARAAAGRDNWFVDEARAALSAPPRIRRGRR